MSALGAAAGVGLLTGLGGGMYRIHPALPAYLAALWCRQDPDDYEDQRAAATRALLTAYAGLGAWLNRQISAGDAGLAFKVIDLQQRTMGHLLGYAIDGRHWGEAGAIVPPLDRYWDARGQYAEAAAWTDRVRLATEPADGTPPAWDSPAGSLWLYLAHSQANRRRLSGHLDDAEQTYRELVVILQAQPSSPEQQGNLAAAYHQLGMVAHGRGVLDEAAQWYARSLAIFEELESGRR